MKEQDWIILGVCGKAHGIKGGFHFNLESGNNSILEVDSQILLKPSTNKSSIDSEGELFNISQITYAHKVMVYLEGVTDRNKVDEMLPFEVYGDRHLFPETKEGEFYISDLIGLEVFCHKSGELIGKVKGYYDNSAQAVLVIAGKKDIELPFLDHFFPVVDLAKNRMEVFIPEVIE